MKMAKHNSKSLNISKFLHLRVPQQYFVLLNLLRKKNIFIKLLTNTRHAKPLSLSIVTWQHKFISFYAYPIAVLTIPVIILLLASENLKSSYKFYEAISLLQKGCAYRLFVKSNWLRDKCSEDQINKVAFILILLVLSFICLS